MGRGRVVPGRAALRLLADIGGTNIRLCLQRSGGTPRGVHRYATADFPSLDAVLHHYLQEPAVRRIGTPSAAAFAIAGPITGDRVKMTNLPWSFSLREIGRTHRLDPVLAVNDFVAVAESVPKLAATDCRKIGSGRAKLGMPIAVLGPGTGLGVSALVPITNSNGSTYWHAVATEGGHITLPAADAQEAAVIDVMRRRHSHISAERALSGQGLVNLYEALATLSGQSASRLTPESVTRRARAADHLAGQTVRMFSAMLGTVAGDLALTYGALGGVYIAGGIVPKLGPLFDERLFRDRFTAKGRYRAYLSAIPTYLVRRRLPAFLGLTAVLDRHAETAVSNVSAAVVGTDGPDVVQAAS